MRFLPHHRTWVVSPPLAIALGCCVALWAGHLATRSISPAVSQIATQADGRFVCGGEFSSKALAHAPGVRTWGSWAGSDDNFGSITLGPFPAPARLRFAACGYPALAGNELFVELAATHARLPIRCDNIGERWRIIDADLPAAWFGQPILLGARDASKGPGGWLALSEPIRGGRGAGNAALIESLAAWSLNGLLLGVPWFAALRLLAPRVRVAPHWMPLLAAAVVAACGYAAFWIYFAHAVAGKIFSAALLGLALAAVLRKKSASEQTHREFYAAPKLLVAIGASYLALLHFFPSSLEFFALAANRLLVGLPGDNTLPHNLAESLFCGVSPKSPGADWLTSDRPPLQTGWLLLGWPITAALGFDDRTASGTAAIWLQLVWVLTAHGLLRTLGLSRSRAGAWVVVMACTGFFAVHSIFTWPKLSAAAFACGAFALWLGAPRENESRATRRTACLLGAALAGLAWLSHGGVAFSFLALAPWLAWRAIRGDRREWAGAAAVFAIFALPWLAYQRFYDPPGNRLFKWHLAGMESKDSRGTWETIHAAYRALTWRQIADHKFANLGQQIAGEWRWWREFSPANATRRRDHEFFLTARALTWWVLGLAALPLALARAWRRGPWRVHAALAAWTLATLLLWCALMYSGGSTVVHQGSFAAMLAMFVLLSAWLDFAGMWTLGVVAVLQAASFATTWAVPNVVVHGPLSLVALALALAAIAALVALVVSERAACLPRVAPMRPAPRVAWKARTGGEITVEN